jgi:hypothetical protein
MLDYWNMRTVGLYAILVATLLGCRSGQCQEMYGACNVRGMANMMRFDEVHGCNVATTPIAGLCVSSAYDVTNPNCATSASIAPDCAISPDGTVFVTTLTNDEYVSGAGWRSTHSASYAQMEAPAPGPADLLRCNAAFCAPACDRSPTPFALFCVDGGLGTNGMDSGAGE